MKQNQIRYLIEIFKSNFKLLILTSVIALIISIFIAFFVLKPIYLSNAVVKATQKSSGLSGLLGGFGEIGSFEDIASGTTGSSKELALYQEILFSRRLAVETIARFKLNDEWEYNYFDDAINNFQKNILLVSSNKQSNTMSIGVYDEYPARAKEIVDFLIERLNEINVELNIKNAKNNREFIEKRYELTKVELRKAEDSLKQFQDKYGVFPDQVVKAAVQGQIQLEVDIKSEEVKLEILRKMLSENEPEIKAQVEKINLLKNQLNSIESEPYSKNNLSLNNTPSLVLEFLRLQRNVEINNKIISFVLPLFEQAKIEENRETPTLLILDNSFIPDKKSKPKRLYVMLIITAICTLSVFTYKVIRAK